jgi:hypothetical protein
MQEWRRAKQQRKIGRSPERDSVVGRNTEQRASTSDDKSPGPKRLSATLSYFAYKALEDRSSREGRSISNLAAYLIETALVAKPNERD